MLKKAILSAAILLSSALPLKAIPYLSSVNIEGKEYTVEIDDTDSKDLLAQVNSDEQTLVDRPTAEKAAYKVLIGKAISDLKIHTANLTCNVIEMFKKPVENAQNISNKVEKITRYFSLDVNVPWWPLMLENPKHFTAKMLAAEDAWHYRNASIKVLEAAKREQNPKKLYEELCFMDDSVQEMSAYMHFLTTSTVSAADLIYTDEIKFTFETLKKTANLKKGEKILGDVAERYDLWNEEVKKLKTDLETRLEETEDYKNLRKNLESRDITKIVKNIKFILSPTEKIYEKTFSIPLYTSENPAFQTSKGMEYANLTAKIEKSCISGKHYNLRFSISAEKAALNKTNISLAIVFPDDITIEDKISQKAYVRINNTKKYEDILPFGEDKTILLELDAADYAIDEAVSMTMKGNIVKINNVWKAGGEKLYNAFLKENQRNVITVMRASAESYDKDYSERSIRVNPSRTGREISKYLFLIPIHDKNSSPFFIYTNAGLNSSMPEGIGRPSGYQDAYNNKIILIPINENDIKYIFDSKLCDEFYSEAIEKMLSIQNEIENLSWNKLKKHSLSLSLEEKISLERNSDKFLEWKEQNPIEYLKSAFSFEAGYLYDTREYIKGYFPPACDYPACEYKSLSKTQELFFGTEDENNGKISRYYKEELEVKFKGEGKFEIKSKNYPSLNRDADIFKPKKPGTAR